MEHRFVCENIGLGQATIIRGNGQTVISKNLPLDELISFWKKELGIPKEDTVILCMQKELYKKIHYKPMSVPQSTLNLLNKYGVQVEIIGEN